MLAKLTARGFALTLSVLLFSTAVFGQKIVTGKVTGPDNQPLLGATISVKGTNVATTTAATGDFTITVPSGRHTLVFTSVGFEEQQIDVGSASNFTVSMKEKVSSLNEIVVTGYTAQKKKDITGSVSVVNMKDIKQTPVGTGEEALQGRAPGVTIISSGQPGGASDIRIRGITAFGNNSPLIIVDGVRGSIHDINVNDIESMQVLKDASAAVYGVAGSNGVIIITTRKGRAGKAKVSYDAFYGTTTRGKGYDMANTQEEANANWLAQMNSGVLPGDPKFGSKQYGTGATPVIPDYIQTYADPNNHKPYGYTLCNCPGDSIVDLKYYDINSAQITKANKIGTNWYDVVTRNAPKQGHNISVSSGSDKSSFFFSLGYLNDQGIQRYSYNKRYTARMNTQFNIKNNIRIGENAYVWYKQNPRFSNQGEGSPFSVAFREDAIIPVYDEKGNFAGTKSQDLGNSSNPFADIYRTRDNKSHEWNVSGNVYAEVDFLKHFTFRTSFGGAIDNQYNYAFHFVAYENAEGNTGANSLTEGASYSTDWTYTNTLNYSNSFGNHTIVGLIGTEAVSNYYRYMNGTRSSYFSENPDYWTLNTGSPSGQANSGGAGQFTLWSQFAKVEYSYAGKYLLNGTIRRDGSSLFTEDVRFGYFPGVSAAWRISQENFLKTVTFINDLKLRYSWAKLGSTSNVLSTNPFNLYAARAGKSYYSIDGSNTVPTSGFYRSNIGNPNTSWEGDIISNVGLDATILNNKLDLTIDWYKKKVSGLLFDASGTQYDYVFIGDATVPKVNIGDMQNTGIDFNATYHGTVSKDLKFDIGAAITTYNNKIKHIPGLPYFNGPQIRNAIVTRNEEGHPVGAFFGYEVVGLFQSADDVAKSPTQADASPGLFKYKDVNGDGKIDDNDRTYIGDPNPKFTYGLNLNVSYKNFDFSAFFFGSQGNDIFNQTKYFTDFPDFFKGGLRREAAVNSWRPDNPNAKVPKIRTTGGFSTDGVSNSYFVSKGSFFRSKQIQLGYTIPAKILSRAGIDRLRIYVQALNLFTITKYDGIDPELPSQPDSNGNILSTYLFGIDQASYPHTPAFLFGVNLSF